MSEPTHEHATAKEKFDVLYTTLVQLHEGLIHFEFQNGAFLFLILGWLLAAGDAQQLLQNSLSIRLALILALLVATGFHMFWVYRHYVRSRLTYKFLLELNYLPPSYLEPRRIHKGLAVSFMVAHVFVSLIIGFCAWLI